MEKIKKLAVQDLKFWVKNDQRESEAVLDDQPIIDAIALEGQTKWNGDCPSCPLAKMGVSRPAGGNAPKKDYENIVSVANSFLSFQQKTRFYYRIRILLQDILQGERERENESWFPGKKRTRFSAYSVLDSA